MNDTAVHELDTTRLAEIAERVWNDLIGTLPPSLIQHIVQRHGSHRVELDVGEPGSGFTLTIVCPESATVRLATSMWGASALDLSSRQLLDAAGEYGNLLASAVKQEIAPDAMIDPPRTRRTSTPQATDDPVDVASFVVDHHEVRVWVGPRSANGGGA